MKNKYKDFTLDDFVKYIEKTKAEDMIDEELLPAFIKKFTESAIKDEDSVIKFLHRQLFDKNIKGYSQ